MSTVTSTDGTTIAYERAGQGEPVILVGGALQYRAIDQRTAELARLLAARHTVLVYDRRGRGESGDTPPYAIEREIEDLAALIEAAGGSAALFGMSSGAVLALDAAAGGLAITRLALYEPPFIVDDTRPPLPADYLTQLDELIARGRRDDAVELFMTAAVGVPAEFAAPMRRAPEWSGFTAVAHTLRYDGAIMGSTMSGAPLPTERWAAVTIPTLVLDGGASAYWTRNGVRALTDVLPAAQRRTLDGQDHAVAPAALAPVLTGFFAG